MCGSLEEAIFTVLACAICGFIHTLGILENDDIIDKDFLQPFNSFIEYIKNGMETKMLYKIEYVKDVKILCDTA